MQLLIGGILDLINMVLPCIVTVFKLICTLFFTFDYWSFQEWEVSALRTS